MKLETLCSKLYDIVTTTISTRSRLKKAKNLEEFQKKIVSSGIDVEKIKLKDNDDDDCPGCSIFYDGVKIACINYRHRCYNIHYMSYILFWDPGREYAELEVQEAIDRINNDIVNKELDELHEKQKEAEEAYRKRMQKLKDEESKLVAKLRPVEGKTP